MRAHRGSNRREWLQLTGLSVLTAAVGSAQAKGREMVLRAGSLQMLFDLETALVRYIRYGQQEILRGVYAAVRDRNWGTIRPQVKLVEKQVGKESFRLVFDVACREGDIAYTWRGTLAGTADSRITYEFAGEAQSTFLRNRIGFCVLHPVEGVAGRPVRIRHGYGKVEASRFPALIAPHQPFFAIAAMEHEVAEGVACAVSFSGDLFETEDQRNWTDASFKTYCTPLAKPYPVSVKAGDKVQQKVEVKLTGKVAPRTQAGSREVTITVGESVGALPELGFGWSGKPHSPAELELVRRLQPHHLRLDLDLDEAGWQQKLQVGESEAERVGCVLQLALHVRTEGVGLQALAKVLRAERAPQVLLYEKQRDATSNELLAKARNALGKMLLGAGTNANFTELNRNHVDAGKADLVMYSINPLVHAFDDRSLVETLPMHAATLMSARSFCGTTPLLAGPITLKQRFNPVATDGKGGGPMVADPRQATAFCAVWTLGSIKYLAEGGARWGTYFETVGPTGLADGGKPFPTYAVFAWLAAQGGTAQQRAQVLRAPSSDALRADALVLRRADGLHALLANYGPQPEVVQVGKQRVKLRGYEWRALRLG